MKSIIKFHCQLCGAAFAQQNNFARHLQKHNDQDAYVELFKINSSQNNFLKKNIIIIIIREVDVAEKGECSSFQAERNFEMKTEEPFNQIDETVVNVADQQTKNRKIVQKNHVCRYCSRSFPSSSLLATHIRVCLQKLHNEKKRFNLKRNTISDPHK